MNASTQTADEMHSWDEGGPVVAQPTVRAAHLSRIDVALIAVAVAATLWRLMPAVDETPFHRDEARWLHDSTILREWANPFGVRWQDEGYENVYGTIDESNQRRNQPPLAMYVLGLGVLLQTGELPENGYWIMTENTRWNAAQGNMPSPEELRAGRRTNVAIAVLTVVALYVLGAWLTNRAGGTVTGLVYGLHPLVKDTASRAWSDPLLGLCIVLAALAGYRLAVRPTWGRTLLFGSLLGLGAATKLSPLGVAAVAGGAGLGILLVQLMRRAGTTRLMRLGLGLLVAPAIAFAVFVAAYPYLWTDPIEHTRRMFAFRTESFRMQAENNPEARVEDRADALRRVGIELGSVASIGGLIDGWTSRDEVAWLRNLDLAIAVIGWLLIAGLAVSRGPSWPPAVMMAVVAAQAGAVIFGSGIVYPRYMLPVLIAVAAGVGVTFGTVLELATRSRLARNPVRAETTFAE